jgi:hypothetical protein
MIKDTRRLKLTLATLLACYVFLELFSYTIYSLAVDKPQPIANSSDPQTEKTTQPRYIPHPFLGYTYRRNSNVLDTESFTTNQWGFPAGKDEPPPTGENAYIVAITGGSVAVQLFIQGQDKIREALQKLPHLKNRKVSVIALAVGGYSQPQQLMAAIHYLLMGGKIDLLVSLDGFNEANNVYVTPYRWQEMMTFSPNSWAIIGEVNFLQRIQDMCLRWMERLRYSMTAKLVLHIAHDFTEQRKQAAWQAMETDTSSKMETFEERQPGKHIRVWKESTLFMQKAMRMNGGIYVGFIQPNLYVKDSKPFTEKEIGLMKMGWADGYKKVSARVNEGYDLLETAANQLQEEEKLHIYNMEKLFSQTTSTVYADVCCHMNKRGVKMMADFIAGKLTELLATPIKHGGNREE